MKRGEIYDVDLGPAVGSEMGGVCPVVVISNDLANERPLLVAVVPAIAATAGEAKPGLVTAEQSGYPIDLVVLATQSRALDPSRFPEHPAGFISAERVAKIGFAPRIYLDL